MDAKRLSNWISTAARRIDDELSPAARRTLHRLVKHRLLTLAAIGGTAIIGGVWYASASSSAALEDAQTARVQQVTEGIQTISDLFARDLEAVRKSARGLQASATRGTDDSVLRASLSDGILFYAELESAIDGIQSIRRILTRPTWKPTSAERQLVDGFFLQAAIKYLNQPEHWREIRKGGTELVRVKKTAEGSDEWAALAFSADAGTTLIVLIDPAETFASVASWGALGAGVGLRSYVAARDGHILVHSRAAYNGFELRGVSAFRETQAGAGERQAHDPWLVPTARALDQLTVTLAAAKTPSLPLYLVVEKQIETALPLDRAPAPPPVASADKDDDPLADDSLGFGWLIALGALAGLAIFLRRRGWGRASVPTAFESELEAELASVSRPVMAEVVAIPPPAAPEKSGGGLVITEVDAPFLSGKPEPVAYGRTFEAAQVERALEHELSDFNQARMRREEQERIDTARAEAERAEIMKRESERLALERADEERRSQEARDIEERLRADAAVVAAEQELVNRFEIEVLKQGDPKRIAYAVTSLGNRLCKAPALFFAYQPMIGKAILTTAVGFTQPISARYGLTFDIGESCMRGILDADARGEVKNLGEHLPLSSMLHIAFGARSFRAWALTGESKFDWSGRSHAKLMGVLVVLAPETVAQSAGARISPLLKQAGQQYEKALPRI